MCKRIRPGPADRLARFLFAEAVVKSLIKEFQITYQSRITMPEDSEKDEELDNFLRKCDNAGQNFQLRPGFYTWLFFFEDSLTLS